MEYIKATLDKLDNIRFNSKGHQCLTNIHKLRCEVNKWKNKANMWKNLFENGIQISI